MLPVVDPWFKP
uniref:Uncharacterized protein n=1 Tax=Arundo donax TaxID=35708 RepID=A0A0A8Y0E3_ARUDO